MRVLVSSLLLSAVLGLGVAAGPASATILTFDLPLDDASAIDQSYGDNVSGSPQGGFSYGVGAEGFTPNVTVAYSDNSRFWGPDFGDLVNVVYTLDGSFELTLTAAAGFVVELFEFDLAGWLQADYTINSVSVRDGGGNVLFSQTNAHIEGDGGGPRRTHFDFSSDPLSASVLIIAFDSSNLGGNADNIGIDNIRFGQQRASQTPVPEPAALGLLGLGLVGLAVAVRRRRRG